MKCDKFIELLSWYLEADLEPKEMAEVEEHLLDCSNCSYELELLKKTLVLARKLPEIEISSETRLHLMRKIKGEAKPKVNTCIWKKSEDEKKVKIFMLETGRRTSSK